MIKLRLAMWYDDVHTTDDLLAYWNSGKDFKILNGPYTSIRDKPNLLQSYKAIQISNKQGDIAYSITE